MYRVGIRFSVWLVRCDARVFFTSFLVIERGPGVRGFPDSAVTC